MSWQRQKALAETAIDWAQVMTKILVSSAIAPLYENVQCRSREKEIFLLCLFCWSQSHQHSQKRGFYNTTKIVIVPLPTYGKKKVCRKSLINSEYAVTNIG